MLSTLLKTWFSHSLPHLQWPTKLLWGNSWLMRAFKLCVLASERELGFRQELFHEFVLYHLTENFLTSITDGWEEQEADPDSMSSYGAKLPPSSLIKNSTVWLAKETLRHTHNRHGTQYLQLRYYSSASEFGKRYPHDGVSEIVSARTTTNGQDIVVAGALRPTGV